MKGLREQLVVFIRRLSVFQRFMVASFTILIAGMLGVGTWIGGQIEANVSRETGATTALYVDSFVAPHLQELASAEELAKLAPNMRVAQVCPRERSPVAVEVEMDGKPYGVQAQPVSDQGAAKRTA